MKNVFLAALFDKNVKMCDGATKAPAYVLFLSCFLQMMDSEEDSDVDTGFYSDGEEAPPPKRRSLLVALRCVYRTVGYTGLQRL